MREARAADVAQLMLRTVEGCQSDLMACFDLLVESNSPGSHALADLEQDLFAVHRSLNLLRVQAKRFAFRGVQPCHLLRSPATGEG